MVAFTFFAKDEGLSAVNIELWSTTFRNIAELLVNNAVDGARYDDVLRSEVVVRDRADLFALLDVDVF